NRCVSGEYLVTTGKVLFDSHAEVIARRSFILFIMKHIELYKTSPDQSIFELQDGTEKLSLKKNITFHLYISTAPCGDAALFTHSCEDTDIVQSEAPSDNHEPLFDTLLQGKLRTKMEAGEGTITVEKK